jgi:hypothetical protein
MQAQPRAYLYRRPVSVPNFTPTFSNYSYPVNMNHSALSTLPLSSDRLLDSQPSNWNSWETGTTSPNNPLITLVFHQLVALGKKLTTNERQAFDTFIAANGQKYFPCQSPMLTTNSTLYIDVKRMWVKFANAVGFDVEEEEKKELECLLRGGSPALHRPITDEPFSSCWAMKWWILKLRVVGSKPFLANILYVVR